MQCSDSTPADWLIQKKSFAAYQFQCVSLLMIVCICAQCISSGRSLSFHYWWWLLFFFFLLCSLPFIYYLRSVGKVKEQCSRSVVLAYYIVSIYAAMDPVLPSDGCIHTTHIHMRTAHTQNTLFCSGGARRPATPPPTPPLTVWWKEKTNRQPSRTLDALVSIASYDICHSTFVL